MLVIQGITLYQLFSPPYLRLPKIALPAELDEPEEPLEYEINLDPGPMGPTPKPVASAPVAQSSSERQSSSQSVPLPIEAQPPSTSQANAAQASASQTSASQTSPSQPSPSQPSPAQPSPAQAAAVVSIAHSTPAPQPLLAIEATPAPSAPEIVLVPSVDVAAAATTELPAQERGARNGAPANSDAVSTPVRPLAMDANAAPDHIAAAPISILPGVQTLNIEPVIAANPVATANRSIDRLPVDLTITDEKPVIGQIADPVQAVDITRPMRVQPDAPKPDLRVEQAKLNIVVAKPTVPAAVARPVLSRADAASANPVSAAAPDLSVDAQAVTPNIAPPTAPAAAARPVLTSAPVKVSAADSVRLEVARGEIGRPTMAVQTPIAATESADSDTSGIDPSTAPSTTAQGSSANAPNADASTAQNSATSSRSDSASGLPSDPFARAGSGKGPRDLLGQGRDAAAQVAANAADSNQGGGAFRRYHDPFADDAPNPLAGLRLREPQMFSDVSRFLVKTFGPAALGFAVGASSEIDDFSGPNAGVLIEKWIQQHHSDLQRECRMRQETMDEHIRRLLCGEP